MIKAVIFDLDGTLLDTSRDIHKVLNESLKKFSVPEISLEHTIKFVGNGAKKLIERAAGEKYKNLVPEIYADFSKAFAENENSLTVLYDGEEIALENLKSYGIKLAVLTNKPQKAAENVCKKYLEKFGFDCICGQTEDTPLKPDPQSALKIIGKFGLKKEECVFVGDGETDVLTAVNAGIKCVSVLWGYRSKEQLTAAGAELFANSFCELEHIICSL